MIGDATRGIGVSITASSENKEPQDYCDSPVFDIMLLMATLVDIPRNPIEAAKKKYNND